MALRQFDLWPFGDLDALGFLGRGRYLSGTGFEKSRLAPTVVVIASLRPSPFLVIARTSERIGRCATFDLRSFVSVVQLANAADVEEGGR
jgi:hypothetical protein